MQAMSFLAYHAFFGLRSILRAVDASSGHRRRDSHTAPGLCRRLFASVADSEYVTRGHDAV
jgi:hypothetical protein